MDKYRYYLSSLDFNKKLLKEVAEVTRKKYEICNISSLNIKPDMNSGLTQTIINFDSLNSDTSNLKSGDYFCIFEKTPCLSIKLRVGFSADIAIETALNKFEVINVDFNKAVGLVKYSA